ncbi:isatin hydrolase-like [Glandiceps talaboti]
MLLICSTIPSTTATGDVNDASPYLDMTYNFNDETMTFPGWPEFNLTVLSRGSDNVFGIYMEANNLCVFEHCGTHIDAPAHYIQGKQRLGSVPLDNLIGAAIRVDIKAKVDNDIDALLDVKDLEDWEEANGRIPDDVILMMYTGWGSRYPNRTLFLGQDADGAMHFPGLGPDGAQWLVDKRKIKAIGTDCPSLDSGSSGGEFRSHIILMLQDIPVFEQVANVDKLPTTGATVFGIPMKVEDGSGGPLRIFATGWRSDVPNPFSISGVGMVGPMAMMIMYIWIAMVLSQVF